jgi:ribosomal-protein-alanine N-acetyltransferase
MDLLIRCMTADDIEKITLLERSCQPHPWSVDLFRQELANPLSRIDVAELDMQIVGYVNSWLVAGDIEIHNVVTDPHFRRKGIARRLLNDLFARTRGLQRVFLEVRAGNQAAISLYLDLGFRLLDRRPGYYHDGEDALIMVRETTFATA